MCDILLREIQSCLLEVYKYPEAIEGELYRYYWQYCNTLPEGWQDDELVQKIVVSLLKRYRFHNPDWKVGDMCDFSISMINCHTKYNVALENLALGYKL